MLSFWDRAWAVHAMMVRDYFKERDAQRKKREEFYQKCMQEIMSESANISKAISEAASKQSGKHIHSDVCDGIIQLPLYGFYLVLQKQKGLKKEQEEVIDLFFSNFSIPYSQRDYLEATRVNNIARKELTDLVGISSEKAGRFWVQFFRILYRTDEDTSYIERVIDAFASITMRFSALSGEMSDNVLTILERFIKNVQAQVVLCRLMPKDEVDFYGDEPFVEHYKKYKTDTIKVCKVLMDEDDEDLNPKDFFEEFTLGIIYQVIRRCKRNREDKIKIINDVLSMINLETSVDGVYIFGEMEDRPKDHTSLLAAMMHMYTDLEDGNPVGWILIARACGKYHLQTDIYVKAVQEAINFIVGMENYLSDRYPMSGFGTIAMHYSKAAVDAINKDIDENVTIVD